MLGAVGGTPGFGLDPGIGFGPVALGARASAGNDLCIMCAGAEGGTQLGLLAGMRHEYRSGAVSVRSGISKVERHSSEKHLYAGDLRR